MRKVVLGIAGSSGSIYAKRLLDKFTIIQDQIEDLGIVMSNNAKFNWELELGDKGYSNYDFKIYEKSDFMAPFASGSAQYDTMIICPCSMGTIGRVASGISNDLLTRAADVILKERRKLIVVPRETPYNLIHIENLKTITLAGGIICPAVPSFYSNPQTITEVVDTVVDRIIDLAGFDLKSYRWGDA